MREIELVTRKWRRILQKFPDLTKSPFEIVCLHQRIMYDPYPSVIFMAYTCPNFVLGRLKKKKRKKKKSFYVFAFSIYNSSDVF